MPWWEIFLIILGGFIVLGLFFSLFFTFAIAYVVYSKTLMRGHSGSWGREHCSEPGNKQLEEMWDKGLEWQKGEKSFIKELEIRSKDGLKLVGEWFDYGFDKTVIILPGRRETLVYSYFYAKPYKDAGVSQEITRIFIQDYVTTATFKIGAESLKNAFTTVPDLRASQTSLGLSVDLNWREGLDFGDVNL